MRPAPAAPPPPPEPARASLAGAAGTAALGAGAAAAVVGAGAGLASLKPKRMPMVANRQGRISSRSPVAPPVRSSGGGIASAGGQPTMARRPHLFDREGDKGKVAAPKRAPAPGKPLATTATFGRTTVRQVAEQHPMGGFARPQVVSEALKPKNTKIGVMNTLRLGAFLLRKGAPAARRRGDAASRWLDENKAAGQAFDQAKHPRGDDGRFAAGGGDQQPLPGSEKVVPLHQRRSLVTLPGYYAQASKHPGMPEAYTGSKRKEQPVGGYKSYELVDQKPRAMTPAAHQAMKTRLHHIVMALAEPTIERGAEPIRSGKRRGESLIPEGTSPRTARRAYALGAALALHKYGVVRHDYAMDDTLKAELTPLEPFILYAHRRVLNTMLATERGGWKPYRAEFGIPFKDKRRDVRTGEVRLRMTPRQQLIKVLRMGGLAKAFAEDKHERDSDGRFAAMAAGGAAAAVAAPASVLHAGEVHRRARVEHIRNHRNAVAGKKVVWRGAPAPDPSPVPRAFGAVYVAAERKVSSKFRHGGHVSRYVLDPALTVEPLHSRKAARIFAARNRREGPGKVTSGDRKYYQHNIRETPMHTAKTHPNLTGKANTIAGAASLWSITGKQAALADRLGVHAVEAPEFRRGDAYAMFNTKHLHFVGSAPAKPKLSPAAKFGAMALKLTRRLHKSAGAGA